MASDLVDRITNDVTALLIDQSHYPILIKGKHNYTGDIQILLCLLLFCPECFFSLFALVELRFMLLGQLLQLAGVLGQPLVLDLLLKQPFAQPVFSAQQEIPRQRRGSRKEENSQVAGFRLGKLRQQVCPGGFE